MSKTITAAQLNAMLKKDAKRSKYGAKKVVVDGLTFDSKKEANRWCELVQLQKAGLIARLERQVRIPLVGERGPIMTDSGKSQRCYVADFKYIDWRINGVWVIEDSKGMATPEFKLKKAILAAQNITVTVT